MVPRDYFPASGVLHSVTNFFSAKQSVENKVLAQPAAIAK